METKILSIVIPTFNMEAYIEACLWSLTTDVPADILQKVEVLVVNDGSTDRSSEIAQHFAEAYPQSISVINKSNGHYGSCVNKGLSVATGQYFRILDADDKFATAGLVTLVEQLSALSECPDVVVTGYTQVFVDSENTSYKAIEVPRNVPIRKMLSANNFGLVQNSCQDLICMHALTFKRSLLLEIGLHLQEGICYTDMEYCYFPLLHAETLQFFDIDLYQYTLGREGQSVSRDSFVKNKRDTIAVMSRLISDYLRISDLAPAKRNDLCYLLANVFSLYATILVYAPKNEDDLVYLAELDKKIQQEPYLNARVSRLTFRKVPFVWLWRKFGLRFTWLSQCS